MLNYMLFSLLLVWVLLPMLPAVIIYRLFPDTNVTASGPFANLTVKTGGAFAAFLIVLAGIAPFVYSMRDGLIAQQKHSEELAQQQHTESIEQQKRDELKKLASGRQYWTVEVPIELVDAEGKKITNPVAIQSYLNPTTLQVETNPSPISVASSKITLRIVTLTPDEFPFVNLKLPRSEKQALDLSDRNTDLIEVHPEMFLMKLKKAMRIQIAQQEVQRVSAQASSADEPLAK